MYSRIIKFNIIIIGTRVRNILLLCTTQNLYFDTLVGSLRMMNLTFKTNQYTFCY